MTIKANLSKELLPPNVSMYRSVIREKMAICYTFFHHTYGSLGQVYFKPISSKQIHMYCEVAGSEGAPLTEKRKGLLMQLSQLVSSQIEQIMDRSKIIL